MKQIIFKYRDDYSHNKWNIQTCIVESLEECIQLYGLNECEYVILENKEIK